MVSEGDEISPGTPMLILEAMKMRNEILSPLQGIIKKIYVSEGDMVPKGHLLLEFELALPDYILPQTIGQGGLFFK